MDGGPGIDTVDYGAEIGSNGVYVNLLGRALLSRSKVVAAPLAFACMPIAAAFSVDATMSVTSTVRSTRSLGECVARSGQELLNFPDQSLLISPLRYVVLAGKHGQLAPGMWSARY